jgi:hypothetical protein
MIKESLSGTRPDGAIDWSWDSVESTERRKIIQEKFYDTGLAFQPIYEVGKDGLSVTGVRYWKTSEAWNDYMNDPVVIDYYSRCNSYNTLHNHSINKTIEEVE